MAPPVMRERKRLIRQKGYVSEEGAAAALRPPPWGRLTCDRVIRLPQFRKPLLACLAHNTAQEGDALRKVGQLFLGDLVVSRVAGFHIGGTKQLEAAFWNLVSWGQTSVRCGTRGSVSLRRWTRLWDRGCKA